MGVDYRIVVEPDQYELYKENNPPDKVIKLPYMIHMQGGVPARNFIWEHSIAEGHERHWVLDDNIRDFFYYNNNKLIRLADATPFVACEEFTDRYQNVIMSGLNYSMFVVSRAKRPPITYNTRVYSMILLSNKTHLRWRGRLNGDTDLSLRVLKSGSPTILLNVFVGGKIATMECKGGNTNDMYLRDDGVDGRLEMAKELERYHPDIVKIVYKWGRWQHSVDYSGFKNLKLKRKPDCKPSSISNMKLISANGNKV